MISAADVKELRERTGAGMMDCKKALTETNGDIEAAIDLLREKGLAAAAKKAGRVAAEGLVHAVFSSCGHKAALIEVNAETDFVAKNMEFVEMVQSFANVVLENEVSDVDSLLKTAYPGGGTVSDALTAKIAKIGENMSIRRFEKFEGENIVNVGYIHGAGKIGVVVRLETPASAEEVQEVGRSLAMQVASMNPKFVCEDEVDPEYVEKEKKVLVLQALNEGKDEKIVEKMVSGRLKKEMKEICLLEQKFVKDGDISVAQYVEQQAKAIGKPIKVVGFSRYEVGEGIEKKGCDLAAEVAAMTQK